MKVVWIASYPKSGNTWMRFLLHHYFWGEPESSLALNHRIPDLHRPVGAIDTTQARLFVKTHYELTDSLPFLPRTDRAIVIRRHPKDVLLSGLNYARLESSRPVDPVAYARAFIEHRGDPMWKQMGFGSWDSHARSWETDRFAVCLTTYESLKADAGGELTRVLAFLGEEVDAARVARAVELSDFKRLQQLERQEKARGSQSLFRGGRASLARQAMFMNKGLTGQSLSSIDPSLDARFDAAFADCLAALGYG